MPRSALLAGLLKGKHFFLSEETVPDHQLISRLGFVQLFKMSEDGTWNLGWLEYVERFFSALSSLSDLPGKPK